MRGEPFGSAATWARDFAILGFLTGVIGPLSAVALGAGPAHFVQAVDEMATYFAIVAPLGAFSGLAFGYLLRAFLLRFPAVPLGVLLLIVPIFGAVLGAVVAWGAAPLARPGYAGADDGLAVILGASAAAFQIMWFWPLYLHRRASETSPASLLGVAVLTGATIGPAVAWLVSSGAPYL